MLKLAKRTWVLLVILLVVVIAAFCVDRFRGFFGRTELTRPGAGLVNDPEPFNPKEVRSTRSSGREPWRRSTTSTSTPSRRRPLNVPLPWTLTLTTTAPAASPNIVAQSDGGSISCRITVDGVVKDERTTDGVNAQTFCLVKSA